VVSVKEVTPLADAVVSGLEKPARRALAAKHNRELINQRGLWDVNMARMEKAYRELARVDGDAGEEVP
jgi:microcystin degradation protein MlrC